MKPLALGARLALVHAGVLAVLLTGFGFVAYHLLQQQLDAAASDDLKELTDGLHGYLRIDGAWRIVHDHTSVATPG